MSENFLTLLMHSMIFHRSIFSFQPHARPKQRLNQIESVDVPFRKAFFALEAIFPDGTPQTRRLHLEVYAPGHNMFPWWPWWKEVGQKALGRQNLDFKLSR